MPLSEEITLPVIGEIRDIHCIGTRRSSSLKTWAATVSTATARCSGRLLRSCQAGAPVPGSLRIVAQAGTVSVNGEVLQEAYIAEPTYLGYDVTFPYTVPEGTVFVMGDNRNASLDSRSSYVGCIDERDILGKVLLCFLPFSDFGVVK